MKKCLSLIAYCLLPIAVFGHANPVSITSIAVSNGVATVTTSAAHNIASNNPGFCIDSSSQSADNICGAATVTSSTTFTVNSGSMAGCVSSCGNARPAPFFVLKGQSPNFGIVTVSGCMWTFVATGAPVTNGVSACSSSLPSSIQSAANSAVASGQWIEQQFTRQYPAGVTVPTIENDILALQVAEQNAQAAANAPGGVTGVFCDAVGC